MTDIVIRKLGANGTVIGKWVTEVFDTFKYDINSPVSPLPLPEENQEENILIKVEGNSAISTIAFVIKDFDTNRITGSGINGDSKTVWDIIKVVKNQFSPVSIEDSYQLAIVDNGVDLISWKGTISKTNFVFASMSPVSAKVTINFLEGNVISIYNIDGAKQPNNLTVVSNDTTDSGDLFISWSVPLDLGTDSPARTGYRIQYRTGSDDWTTVSFTSTGTSKTISLLTPGYKYEVRVAIQTGDTVGLYSETRTAIAT